jgi:hypothetical protein
LAHPESIATETLEEKGKKGAKKEEGIRESAKQVFGWEDRRQIFCTFWLLPHNHCLELLNHYCHKYHY